MIVNQDIYDGSLLKERFAYKYFGKKVLATGNIISFRAPMEVTLNLIDLEDSMKNDFIYSDDAVNFCWEIPNLDPFGAVAFQRLFNTQIAFTLASLTGKSIGLDGDDLIFHDESIPVTKKFPEGGKGKCSVSITYSKNNIVIGHTGINITAGKQAPDFAYSTGLDTDQIKEFIDKVESIFYFLTQDIFTATTKVIV